MPHFLWIGILLTVFGCSQKSNTPNVVSPKKATNLVRKAKPEKVKVTSGKFNVDEFVKKVLPKNWEKDLWFEEINKKHGYARMGYKGEGYNEFFLFVGTKWKLLAVTSWGCGPACSQEVKLYKFANGKHTSIPLESLLSKEAKENLDYYIPTCQNEDATKSWSNDKCFLLVEFPEFGTLVELFVAQYKDDEKPEGKPMGRLLWNRKKHNFSWVK